MELRAPDPEKIRVIEYDFTFANATGVGITCFPSLGDRVEEHEDSWVFFFVPRPPSKFGKRQTVFRPVQTLVYSEGERAYVDPVELRKRVKEAADVEKKARATKA